MRQLQSRVQGIRFPTRGQKAASAEKVGNCLSGERPESMNPPNTIRSPYRLSKNLSLLKVFSLTLLFLTLSIFGGVTVHGQITFGDPDDRFINDIDRIHQGDLIEIDVVGSFEFDWRGTLNPEGFIDGMERLPEPVYARCRSTTQIANSIAQGFRKVLRDPVVEVRIIDRNNRALSFIDGAVKTPLRLRIKRDLYLNELIVLAGGFTDSIGDEISVFRPAGASCEGARDGTVPNGPVTQVVKVKELIGGIGKTNVKILPGDVVTVVESLLIYVIGGVRNPQKISARSGITLSRAIDTAGGMAKKGQADSITVYRRRGIEPQVIEVDLDKVRSGEKEDLALEANDIVEVPLRGEEKRKFAPVIEGQRADRKQIPLRVIE